MSEKLERCPSRSPGKATEYGTLPKGKQCGLPKGHDGDHTLLVPSGVPWEKTTSGEEPKGEMTDRELLELAAKAAGIPTDLAHGGFIDAAGVWYVTRYWNPLTNDADAFRLMIKLHLSVTVFNGFVEAEWADLECSELHEEKIKCDECYEGIEAKYAATRRAITRAAAAVGKERE